MAQILIEFFGVCIQYKPALQKLNEVFCHSKYYAREGCPKVSKNCIFI